MSSNLWIKQGIYDPTKRYAFTNITDEPFVFHWDKKPITVKSKETVELPQHLAILATTNLVDQIMTKEIKEEEDKMRLETRNPYYRSPRGSAPGIPAAREPYEKKICRELAPNESQISESQLGVIRAQMADAIINDIKAEASPKIDKVGISAEEFAGVNLPKQ